MPRASNQRRNHGQRYPVPKAELTGIYGGLVKRMSRKMLGEVPEAAEVM